MNKIKINVLRKLAKKPEYATKHSAGMDLCACVEEEIELLPSEVRMIPTGISMEIPEHFFGMVTSRSGLAAKSGIVVFNAPGIIDSDYRGEICCILTNNSSETFKITNCMRIAQLIIQKYEIVDLIETDSLSQTERGKGGFGSTGV